MYRDSRLLARFYIIRKFGQIIRNHLQLLQKIEIQISKMFNERKENIKVKVYFT